ncbi:MAG: SDR family NAD(P)-dependent oxidoreductase, partial [Burkholderiaceae bacterium]
MADGGAEHGFAFLAYELPTARLDSDLETHTIPMVKNSMQFNPAASHRLGRPRLLIVGCGDVGMRLLPLVRTRFRVFAVTSRPERCAELRAAGAIPVVADLD